MAIESKRIAKNTGILYLRMLFMMAVNLYTSRILLSALGVVDFGLYNVIGGVVLMIGFLQGTMSTSSSRFVTVALSKGNMSQMKNTFSSILLINFFLALIIVALAESVGLWFLEEKMSIPDARISASIWVYQFSVVSVAMNIITVPFNASIIAHEKMNAFAYISLFDAISKLLVVYLICSSPFDRLIFYAFLVLIVQIVDIVIYAVYCLNNFPETRIRLYCEKCIIKEISSFVIWASYGSFVSVGFTQGLNIILNIFFGPAINAARGIAVQVQNATLNFVTNFQTAINPQLMKSTAGCNYYDAQNLLILSSKYSFFLLCFLCLPLIVETPFVLGLWLKDVPKYSIPFCRIILIISIWGSLANPLRIVNHAEGNIKIFQISECTLLLLIMPISYILLKNYNIPILVFIVHLSIEIIAQFVRIAIVVPKIKMSFLTYIKQVYIRLIPVFSLPLIFAFFFHILLNQSNEALRFGVVSFLCEMVLLLVVLWVGLTKTEMTLVKRSMLKFINI